MKNFIIILAAIAAFSNSAFAQKKNKNAAVTTADTAIAKPEKQQVRYIYKNCSDGNVIYVNEEVTSHIIFPEKIKLVDISTNKIIGNQCTDNIVRIKPAERLQNYELAGTVTLIGERYMAQYNVVFTTEPCNAYSMFSVPFNDLKQYTNPNVLMPESAMSKYCWAIYSSKRKFYNIHSTANGIKAVINNIYTVDDYFFIDFSLYNKTKLKYDIEEMRIKLTDKKETKSTNSQTIELTPAYSLNKSKNFKKNYRNVLVIPKLTFPDEKVLRLEISENQISGRVINLVMEYSDILNADSFDNLIKN